MPDCWLEVSTRKVLRPTISTQVFLGFPVSISKCWDGSQHSKLPSRLKFISNQFHILYTCKITTVTGWQPNCSYYYYYYKLLGKTRIFLTLFQVVGIVTADVGEIIFTKDHITAQSWLSLKVSVNRLKTRCPQLCVKLRKEFLSLFLRHNAFSKI